MSFLHRPPNLGVAPLLNGYRRKLFNPTHVIKAVIERVEYNEKEKANVWIHRLSFKDIFERAEFLQTEYHENRENLNALFDKYPLFGVPFAVKDNMDVKDLPTTCGFPGYKYTAKDTAKCVETVLSKGGILIGKTNMDMFATGLTGTGSPAFGIPRNPINADLVPGGSSGGSAVAVASNLVSFSLGTDTAGSCRVPAAMNHIYGIKPSKNVISTEGIVPASKSFDCASIFANNLEDAFIILDNLKEESLKYTVDESEPFRYGIPKNILSEKYIPWYFNGDNEYFEVFKETIKSVNGECVEIDFDPIFEVGKMLYASALVRERLECIPFEEGNVGEYSKLIQVISSNKNHYTDEEFSAALRILEQKKIEMNDKLWNELKLDFICVPSVAKNYTIKEVMECPTGLASELQRYTSFVNLLDMCAIAMPVKIKKYKNGDQPFGVTLIGQNMKDLNLMTYSSIIHESVFSEEIKSVN